MGDIIDTEASGNLEQANETSPEEISPDSKNPLPIIALNENIWDDENQKNVYHGALANALDADSVLDIAVSGPYGAGKSFVISTFFNQEEYKKDTIYVSLGTFKPKSKDTDKPKGIGKAVKEKVDSEYILDGEDERQEIEQAILQQLIYHVTPDKTPSSRILRIAKIPKEKRRNAIRDLFITLLCLSIVIKPNIFNYPEYESFKILFFVIQVIALVILLYHISKALFSVFGTIKNIKISRLGTNLGQIDFSSGNSGSIFNRHLDEILHFYECTDYKYVVIEDLDRFNDIEIFTRLRSLNKAINNYPSIASDEEADKRKVRFIYAVKDDLFVKDSRDRTKFFDVIIPVIPIISFNNSADKINKVLSDVGLADDLDSQFIWEISTFLSDMRQVKNIVNEYMVYKSLLPQASDKHRLFAALVYKNLEPLDFSLFYNKEGNLYALQKLRPILLPKAKEKLEEEKKALVEQLTSLDEKVLTSVEELNRIYISRALNLLPVTNNSVTPIYDQKVSIDELTNLANFDKYYLKRQYYVAKSGGKVSIHVDDLDTEFQTPGQYNVRKSLIIEKYKVDLIKAEIDELDRRLMDFEVLSLQFILKEVGYPGRPLESLVGKNFPKEDLEIAQAIDSSVPLLKYLIINGHLDDSMQSYLGYFHSDGISEQDNDFLQYLFSGGSTVKPPQLDNPGYLLKKLGPEHYDREQILYPQLVKELISSRKSFPKQYHKVLKLINSAKRHLSLLDGFKGEEDYSPLIVDLARQKRSFWDDIAERSEEELAPFFKTIIYNLNVEQVVALNKSGHLKRWLTGITNIGLLLEPDKFDVLQSVIEKFGVQFEKLTDLAYIDSVVWDFLYKNNFYAMNPQMIGQIIAASDTTGQEENLLRADKANYTTVKELELSTLIDYIDDHPQLYLENVSLAMSSNIDESEGSLLYFVNHADVTKDTKLKFASRQKTPITKLSDVKDEYLSLIMSTAKFTINWGNIIHYYKVKKGIDEHLLKLLNSPQVMKTKGFLSPSFTEQSDWQELTALLTQILINEELKLPSFQKLLKVLPDATKLYDILSRLKDNERKAYVLENSFIPVTSEGITLLKSVDSDFFVSFLRRYAIQIRRSGLEDTSWEETICNSQVISDQQKDDLIHELYHVSDDDVEGGDTGQGI